MAFVINRSLTWIGNALNRALGVGGGGTTGPGVVPDVIVPGIDVFGWERIDQIKSDVNQGAVGVQTVDPKVTVDWVAGPTFPAVVPDGIVRIMLYAHMQHNDPVSRRCWLVYLDRLTNAEVKVPVDTTDTLPAGVPAAAVRPFILRGGDGFLGRTISMAVGSAGTIRYTWLDLKEGEYVPYLL